MSRIRNASSSGSIEIPERDTEYDYDESYQCRDCNMFFTTADLFKTHKTKFCVNSSFFDERRIQEQIERHKKKRAQESGVGVTFDDVKMFLSGEEDVNLGADSVQTMTLSDLRQTFRANERQLEALQDQVVRAQEQEKVAELKRLKIELTKQRQKKDSDEVNLIRRMRELEEKRKQEMKSRLEVETVKRELSGIDKRRLVKLEEEKKRALAEIAAERAALENREKQALLAIQELEDSLREQEDDFHKQQVHLQTIMEGKDKAPETVVLEAQKKNMKDRGENIAKLRMHQHQLLKEKDVVLERMAELKKIGKKGQSPEEIGDAKSMLAGLQAQFDKDQDRLAKLKEEATLASHDLQKAKKHFDVEVDPEIGDGSGNHMPYSMDLQGRILGVDPLESFGGVHEKYDQALSGISDVSDGSREAMLDAMQGKFMVQVKDQGGIAEMLKETEELRKQKEDFKKEKEAFDASKEKATQELKSVKNKMLMKAVVSNFKQGKKEGDLTKQIEEATTKAQAAKKTADPAPRPRSVSRQSPPVGDANMSQERSQLLRDIAALKSEYLEGGGADKDLLYSIEELERQSAAIASQPAPPPAFPGMPGTMSGMPGAMSGMPGAMSGMPGMMSGMPGQNPYSSLPWMQIPGMSAGGPMGMGPGMGGPMSSMGGLGNPLLQQQLMQTQRLLSQQEEENKRLMQYMEDMRQQKERNSFLEKQKSFEESMLQMQQRMAQMSRSRRLGAAGGPSLAGMDGVGAQDPLLSEIAEMTLDPMEKDSPLYQLRRQHLEEMARLKFKQAELLEKRKLEDLELQKRDMEEQAAFHGRETAAQQPQPPTSRSTVAASRVSTVRSQGKAAPTSGYVPEEGFYVHFDMSKGLPTSVEYTQLAFAFYDASNMKGPIRKTEAVDTRALDREGKRIGEFDFRKLFKNISPIKSLRIIIELQIMDDPPPEGDNASPPVIESIGYTMVEVFDEDGVFREGKWRVPCFLPPVDASLPIGDLAHKSHVGELEAFVRLYNHRDGDKEEDMVFDPYTSPDYFAIPEVYQQVHQQKRASSSAASTRGSNVPLGVWIQGVEGFNREASLQARISIYEDNIITHNRQGADRSWSSEFVGKAELGKYTFANGFVFLDTEYKENIRVVVELWEGETAADARLVGWTVVDAYTDLGQVDVGSRSLRIRDPPLQVTLGEESTDPSPNQSGRIICTLYDPHDPPEEVTPMEKSDALPWIESKGDFMAANKKPVIKGDGVDIYVDGARFLPRNVTISKVLFEVVNSNRRPLPPTTGKSRTGAVAQQSSPAFSPIFDCKAEFRSGALVFDPSLTLLLQVVAVDLFTMQKGVVGYAALPLFVTAGGQQSSSADTIFYVNEGNFQVRLYQSGLPASGLVTANAITTGLAVPCATVLIRMRKALRNSKNATMSSLYMKKEAALAAGVLIPAPNYEDRAYNSAHSLPTDDEKAMYPTLAQMTSSMVSDLVYDAGGPDSDGEVINGVLRRPTEEDITQFMEEALPNIPKTPYGSWQLDYIIPYKSNVGFKIHVDSVRNVPKKALCKAVVGIHPHSGYYGQYKFTDNVEYTRETDWESSTLHSTVWKDVFTSFKIATAASNFAVIEIHGYDMGKKNKIFIGHTFLRVFASGIFIRTGAFQLPIFKDLPSKEVLALLEKGRIRKTLAELVKDGKLKLVDGCSVFVRLVDQQRKSEFSSFDPEVASTIELDPKLLVKYRKDDTSKLLHAALPKGALKEELDVLFNEMLSQETGITHYEDEDAAPTDEAEEDGQADTLSRQHTIRQTESDADLGMDPSSSQLAGMRKNGAASRQSGAISRRSDARSQASARSSKSKK
jgi:hypothetical protein